MKLQEINKRQTELSYRKEKLSQELMMIDIELANLRKRKKECGVIQ